MTEHRDSLRQSIVAVSAVLAIVGSFIGSGAAGGMQIQNASGGALSADATPIAPGGPAFSIWTAIYLGLVAYTIWQLLPSQKTDDRQRRLGYPVAASLLLNAAWILSVQFGLLWLSVPVIVALLAVLVWAFRIAVASRPRNLVETIVVDGTIGLYLGWVCVATAANVAAVLVDAGFDGFGINRDVWAVGVIAVAGLVGRSARRLRPGAPRPGRVAVLGTGLGGCRPANRRPALTPTRSRPSSRSSRSSSSP